MNIATHTRLALATLLTAAIPLASFGQLSAADDFETYAGSPIGAAGGTGDWTSLWSINSQNEGGVYLHTSGKIDGTRSVGLYGNASAIGQSISRAFPACTNDLVIRASFRGDINLESGNPPSNRRMAFTVRTGNDASHFGNQRLSFFFAQGSSSFQWYDGENRSSNAVTYANGHIYDLQVLLSPGNRSYSFAISNRNTGATAAYSGNWTTGSAGDPIGSIAFLMRGPIGAGNDTFLDSITVSAPDYTPPALPGLPFKEGAEWRYFKGTSTPPVQGTNQWYRPEYDDIAWLGPAPSGFGYGDSDDATALSDMQNNYLAVFTRKQFLVENPAAITHLTLAADYDDGFVAYLNGVEVARRNLPAGAITHTTAALSNHDPSRAGQDEWTCNCEPNPKEYIEIDPALLVSGTNFLAVSGHNLSLASSDFSLIVELYTNVALTRGPFLQMPNQGQVSVLWRTAALSDSAVDYGFDTNYTGGTVSAPALTRIHELELPAFPPGTTVYYRVRSSGEVMRENHFIAPKIPGQKFRLLVMADYGTASPSTATIANLALSQNPDVMITCGDNVQQLSAPVGLFDSDWFGPLAGLIGRVPMMAALGNHDIRIEQGRWYLDALSLPTNGPPGLEERNYSFDYGNAHFVMLDANAFEPDYETAYTNAADMRPKIITWLTNDLHNTTQTWKFVAYHQPPYTSQGLHADSEGVKANLSPIYERYGVNIAFQGHNHFYERINPINGVHYFTVGSGGYGIHGLSNQREFSAKIFRDKFDFLILDIDGPRLELRCIDIDGVVQDTYDIDLTHPFKMDGLLDSTNWVRAVNGLKLNAAIRGPYLYLATQDAGEGNDHFIYVSTSAAPMRAANWAKSGDVMQWGAYLADENGGGGALAGYYSWFDASGQAMTDTAVARAITSGLNNNGTNENGVLEGALNLTSYFGSFPTQLWLAAAAYGTLDGGALVASAQVPAGNGNGTIEADEFLVINTRDLALDLPIADAGTDQSVEAGMWAVLDGTASHSPAGLPLTHDWQQTGGPAVQTANLDQPQAAFVITSNVIANTDTTFRLRVNDGRFDSDDDSTTVTLFPMLDSDQDGLSDYEETTGYNNILTPPDPGGFTTNPNHPDTDGDGATDGDEALAGTDPGNSNSTFKIVSGKPAGTDEIQLDWNTIPGRTYHVEYIAPLPTETWNELIIFEATSSLSRVTDTNTANFTERYYRIGVEY